MKNEQTQGGKNLPSTEAGAGNVSLTGDALRLFDQEQAARRGEQPAPQSYSVRGAQDVKMPEGGADVVDLQTYSPDGAKMGTW